MKKIIISIGLCLGFSALMVLQMLVHGQKLTADKIKTNVEKYSVYESKFATMKVETVNKEKIVLKEIKEEIVILNFWASWCTPCVAEFKSLNKLIEKFGPKIKVIGINNDTEDGQKEVIKMEKKYALKFPSVVDEEGDIASSFNITRVPATVVYHKGKVIHFSNKEFDFVNDKFTRLLESKFTP
jgi:thiol-disulfide isomerase/thioredoxin